MTERMDNNLVDRIDSEVSLKGSLAALGLNSLYPIRTSTTQTALASILTLYRRKLGLELG